MGERSNIFVRIRAKERSSDKNYKHETFSVSTISGAMGSV